MRYPGPDEDSESNSLWDTEDHLHIFDDSTISEYSPTASQDEDHVMGSRDQYPARPTTPEPQHRSRQRSFNRPLRFGSVIAENIAGPSYQLQRGPVRRRTSTSHHHDNHCHDNHSPPTNNIHSDSSSSFEYFVPVISINVPSRQNQRLSRARRNSARLGSNSSLSRNSDQSEAHVTSSPHVTSPRVGSNSSLSRNSNQPEAGERPLYIHRPQSPSRIPAPMYRNPLFRNAVSNGSSTAGTGDGNYQQTRSNTIQNMSRPSAVVSHSQTATTNTAFAPSSPNCNYSYLDHSNSAVARFIRPPISIPTQLTDSSTQTESRGLNNQQTDPLAEDSLIRRFSDDELAFDNFIQLTEPSLINCDYGTLGASSQLSTSYTNQISSSRNLTSDRERARCDSTENSSTVSVQSTSGLSMKSRGITPKHPHDSPSDYSDDSDTSTPQKVDESSHGDGRDAAERKQDSLKHESPGDEMVIANSSRKHESSGDRSMIAIVGVNPGPSGLCKDTLTSAELKAELVLDDTTVLKNGKCRITFEDLHHNDLANLLDQNVSIKLEEGNVVVLTVTSLNCESGEKGLLPKPIYKKVSRYLGGQVILTEHRKKVTFSDKLVDEREFWEEEEEEEAVSSSGWEELFRGREDGEEEEEEEEDILSGLEEFEED